MKIRDQARVIEAFISRVGSVDKADKALNWVPCLIRLQRKRWFCEPTVARNALLLDYTTTLAVPDCADVHTLLLNVNALGIGRAGEGG